MLKLGRNSKRLNGGPMESEWRKLGETVNVERGVGDDEGEGQETMKKMKTV